ncbi:MAG: DUF4160 domain-containing protein [Spartobacteria bacterium]
MPTVLRSGPFRFFFYSADRDEPPHVHVQRDRAKANFWLQPVVFESGAGFNAKDLLELQQLITEHETVFLEAWHDYFGS